MRHRLMADKGWASQYILAVLPDNLVGNMQKLIFQCLHYLFPAHNIRDYVYVLHSKWWDRFKIPDFKYFKCSNASFF